MAEIKIYDYIDEFWGDVCCVGMGNNHSSVIVPKIDAAIEAKEDIEVKFNTGGGSVFCGLAIANALARAKEAGLKVTTINDALCASIGTVIFMQGQERISYNSLFMIHKPSGFYFGNMTADDMAKEQAALDSIQETIVDAYLPTGLERERISDMVNAETWLSPESCLLLGFTTENRASQTEDKIDVFEDSIKSISGTANQAFANKYFNSVTTKKINMNNVEKALNENNSLLKDLGEKFANFFKGKSFSNEAEEVTNASVQLEDESYLYYDGELAIGTEVFTDEALTTKPEDGDHTLMDGRTVNVLDGKVTGIQDVEDKLTNEALTEKLNAANDEIADLKTQISGLTNAIETSNKMLKSLKEVKSNYKPQGRQQEFANAQKPKEENSKFVKPNKKK